jgi:DNA gyrase subunit A
VEALALKPSERIEQALPDGEGTYLALLSQRGYVLPVNRPYLRPGSALYDTRKHGPLAAACWTTGRGELLIATRQGLAVRFPERGLPVGGGQGVRLKEGDAAIAIVAMGPDSGVFMVGADGMGTIRLMSGFGANKAPGAGGKIAMKTEELVGAVIVDEDDDLFVISRLSKVIRFQAAEVPAKEGVVQGVRCMALRADEAVAVARGQAHSD